MRRDEWQEQKKQDNIFSRAAKAVVKTAAPILVSGMIVIGSTLGFAGCQKTPQGPTSEPIVNTNTTNNNTQNNNETQNQGNQTPQNPNQENQTPQTPVGKTEQELLAEKSTVWSNFVTSLASGNYKVNITSGNSSYEYSVDDNAVVKEVTGSEVTYYVFDATNGNYSLVSTDGTTFEKQTTSVADAGDFFYDTISGATVTALGENGAFVVTTANGTQYTASHDAGGNLVLISSNATAKVSEIGSIELTVPEIASNNIYEVDKQGNKIFNCALIGEVVENWLKGDNQYGEDYISYIYKLKLPNAAAETVPDFKKVLYVRATEDKVSVVYLADYKGAGMYIVDNRFSNADFYNGLQNGTIKTVDDLKNYLNSHRDLITTNNVAITNIDYTTLDDDYATVHKTQFEELTKSVFNRIETVGTHSYKDTVNENSTLDGFSDGTILFAYKTDVSAESAGSGLGQSQWWTQNYLIERNGKYEWVKFTVISSTYNNVSNCYENVLAGESDASKSSYWYVSTAEIKENLDKTNIELFENENNIGKVLGN